MKVPAPSLEYTLLATGGRAEETTRSRSLSPSRSPSTASRIHTREPSACPLSVNVPAPSFSQILVGLVE